MTTGLSPRTAVIRWSLFAIVVGIVLGSTAPIALDSLARIQALAPDKLAWIASRVIAFLSYGAVAGSVVWGLVLSSHLLDRLAHRPVSLNLHQDLAAIGLGLGGVHAALLGLDPTIGFSAGAIFIPFASPYRPLWVGLGQLTLWVMAVVVASFYVKRWIGQRAWRLLHLVTFLAFAGATAHGITAGSDTGSAWAWWTYVGVTALVLFLFVYRLEDAIAGRVERRRQRASAPARPAAPGGAAVTGSAPAIGPASRAGQVARRALQASPGAPGLRCPTGARIRAPLGRRVAHHAGMRARIAMGQAAPRASSIPAWAPIAIVAAGAAAPDVRLEALLAVAAGWRILDLAGRPRLAGAWLATLPAAAILAWAAAGPPEVTPGLASCASPLSPAALRRVGELLVALAAVAMLATQRPVSASLGLRLPPDARVTAAAVAAPLVLVPASLWIGPALAGPFFGHVGLATSNLAALLPAAVFGAANAVAEEVAYRGALIGWASPALGITGAIVAQGIVFGFAHLGSDVTGLAPLLWLGMTVAGIAAGIIAVRTHSLLLPIAAHAAFDVPMYYALACRAG